MLSPAYKAYELDDALLACPFHRVASDDIAQGEELSVRSAGAFGAETKTLGRRKAYLVRVNLYSPQSVQTGESTS